MSVSLATKTARTSTRAKLEWLETRRQGIGATDAGAIMEVNPYCTPHDVWLDKMGLGETKETIPMRLGIYLEPFIAKEYQAITRAKVYTSHHYQHPKHSWAMCTPDREVNLTHDGHKFSGLLECKSVGHFAAKNFGQDGSDQIPEHYMVQICWQLLVTGKDFVHLAAMIDNRDLRIFTYTLNPELSSIAHVFDPDMCRTIFNVCGRFWKHNVLGKNEPPLSGEDSDTEWVKGERSTYDNGKMTNTDEEHDKLAILGARRVVRAERAELLKSETMNRLKKFMADRGADTLESSVGFFTWKLNKNGVASFRTPYKGRRS